LGFIAGLCSAQPISFALPPVGEHIGEEEGTHARIERSEEEWTRVAHGPPLPGFSPAQELAIDLADLLHQLAKAMVVVEGLGDLPLRILGHIIHLRAPSRVACGEVILGAVTGTVGAFASRLAARLVSLDEGTAEQAIEGWQLAY